MISWTYITNDENTARYTLGKLGSKMLFFIGINPSTARPDDLDRTVARVENFVNNNGYDGWVMLNVYAQRATNPNDMHRELDGEIHTENVNQIARLVKEHPSAEVCAAWGTEIDRRSYLKNCLRDIVGAIGTDKRWIHLHHLTKYNHPRHPLYLPSDAAFSAFDIETYING